VSLCKKINLLFGDEIKVKVENKKVLIIVIIIAVVSFLAYAFLNSSSIVGDKNISLNSGDNLNQNSGETNQNIENEYTYISGEKTIDNIRFNNIRIRLERGNKSELIADVENLTDKYVESKHIRVKAVDANGEVIQTFASFLVELGPYETNTFKAYVLADITDVANVEFEEIMD